MIELLNKRMLMDRFEMEGEIIDGRIVADTREKEKGQQQARDDPHVIAERQHEEGRDTLSQRQWFVRNINREFLILGMVIADKESH